jgi:hypothetical protein
MISLYFPLLFLHLLSLDAMDSIPLTAAPACRLPVRRLLPVPPSVLLSFPSV